MSSPPPPAAQSPSAPPIEADIEDNVPDLDVDLDLALDGANDPKPEETLDTAIQEAREPTKKDISLRDFVSKMDDYAPIIPDAVTAHHLTLSGLDPATTPLPLQRLLALATQKFIADIAADAYQYSRMRASNTSSTNPLAGAGLQPEQGQGGGAGGAGAGGAGGKGAAGKDDKGKGHVLGVQRAGYGGGGANAGASAGKAVLTMEDLGCAVGEYGVNVKRGEFYR